MTVKHICEGVFVISPCWVLKTNNKISLISLTLLTLNLIEDILNVKNSSFWYICILRVLKRNIVY